MKWLLLSSFFFLLSSFFFLLSSCWLLCHIRSGVFPFLFIYLFLLYVCVEESVIRF